MPATIERNIVMVQTDEPFDETVNKSLVAVIAAVLQGVGGSYVVYAGDERQEVSDPQPEPSGLRV